MSKRRRNPRFTRTGEKCFPVETEGEGKKRKRDRILEEMKISVQHDKWELSLPFLTETRRKKLTDNIRELEKEIKGRTE